MAAQVASKPAWIKLPNMPLVSNIFLPTAPVPKTAEELDFNVTLAPCIRKGCEETVKPLLQELSEARRSALTALDPSRTISSTTMIFADTSKYLSLLKGFRQKSQAPPEEGAAAAGEDLPSAEVAAANVAADSSAEDGEKNKGTPGEDKNTATAPAIKGTGEEDEDAPIPALPLDEDGNADASGAGTETSASAADASNENGTSGKTKSKKKKKGEKIQISPQVQDGTLRHMIAFQWRDLGDADGGSFRLGDTMLEEASVLFALAQVMLQKAKAEPLNDHSMLDVFKWLKQAAGVVSAVIDVVKEAGAPIDHTSADLKNGLLDVLVDCSLAQGQHITVRRAMMTMASNKAITHMLIAKLCHDTAERYRAMDAKAKVLCGEQKEGVGAYFLAHIRYKTLFFLAMAYSMVGIERIESDPENLGYGIRNMLTAQDLFAKAELAGKKFIEAARSIVFVDNLTILQSLNDCQDVVNRILEKAQKENNTVFFKCVPAKPDALPDRMSNISSEEFQAYDVNPAWTSEMVQSFDPSKTPNLNLGPVPLQVECCEVS